MVDKKGTRFSRFSGPIPTISKTSPWASLYISLDILTSAPFGNTCVRIVEKVPAVFSPTMVTYGKSLRHNVKRDQDQKLCSCKYSG